MIVVDCGHGNIFSIRRALEINGISAEVVQDPAAIAAADGIILPGVGAFSSVMSGLKSRRLDTAILDAVARGTPLLGICVGMQVLFEQSSEFGNQKGFGLIGGQVDRLPEQNGADGQRIPNVGWREIAFCGEEHMTAPYAPSEMMYFVHSFAPQNVPDENVIGRISFNDHSIPVMVRRANVIGCQFHPERSGPKGVALIARFAQSLDELRG